MTIATLGVGRAQNGGGGGGGGGAARAHPKIYKSTPMLAQLKTRTVNEIIINIIEQTSSVRVK